MAGILSKLSRKDNRASESSENTLRPSRDATDPSQVKGEELSDEPFKLFSFRVFIMGALVSLGGFIFGMWTPLLCCITRTEVGE